MRYARPNIAITGSIIHHLQAPVTYMPKRLKPQFPMSRHTIMACSFLLSMLHALPAQDLEWIACAGNGAAPNSAHDMIYDQDRGVSVLLSSSIPPIQHWEWDGSSWILWSPDAIPQPTPSVTPTSGGSIIRQRKLSSHALFDNGRRRLQVSTQFKTTFAPNTPPFVSSWTFTGETWAFDGLAWTLATTQGSLTEADVAAACLDSQSTPVNYGGTIYCTNPHMCMAMPPISSGAFVGLRGMNWTGMASSTPGPGGRTGCSMTYDTARQRLVLYGGTRLPGPPNPGPQNLNDTWEYDGTAWHPSSSFGPPAGSQRIIFNSYRQRCQLLSSDQAGSGHVRVWEWDGSAWSSFSIPGPISRDGYVYCYDSNRQRTVVFNGAGPGSPTVWELSPRIRGAAATYTPNQVPAASPTAPLQGLAISPIPISGALLFGGTTSTGPNFLTYVLTDTTWTPQFPPFTPATRTEHTLLLDPVRQNNLLFGGKNPLGTPLADTWTWTNNQWNLISTPTAPPARSGHRMAFDRTANLGLLFGGEDATGTALSDFWSWNGTTWAQLTPTTLPPARARHGMAFDALRNRTIVHGGKNGASRLSDVWEWDGTTWTEASAAVRPSERHGPAMVYDTARNRMTLFGGRDATQFFGDTWQLANNPGPLNPGLAWQRKTTTTAPTARNSNDLAFDTARNEIVMFGGYDNTFLGDTWTFDSSAWTQKTPANSPPARSTHATAFDAARGNTVVFGGFNPTLGRLSDTWTWDGSNWTQVATTTQPSPRMFARMSYDATRQRVVLFGGSDAVNSFLSDTWEFDGSNWTLVAEAGTGPSARQCAMMCFDPLRNETVLFGGGTNALVDAQTWAWNGTTWLQRTPANAPTPRWQGSMAFDSSRGKVVLYGGASAGWATNYSDTWEWDGANWQPTQLRRADGDWNPGARDGHAMAYDPRAERVVLHGGETASGCQQDVWSWNGTEWTIHLTQSGSVPSARTGAQLIHDNGTNRMLLFAGGCGTSYTNDLWQLSLPTFARATSYGSACVGSNGPLALAVVNNSLPVIGQTLQLEMSGIPLYSPCIGYVGLSNETFAGVPLPFSLDFLRLYGCFAYMSADLEFPIGLPNNATNTAAWNLAIPLDPIFLSLHIYLQGLALEFGGIRRATVTNGIDARIGDR